MHKSFYASLLLLMLGVLVLAAWHPTIPASAQGQVLAALANNQPETWNMGITVEVTPTYNAIIGRLVSDVGAFRSARANQAVTIFPAPATARTIQSASFNLLSRTGSYSGNARLSLVIYNYAGGLQHTVSSTTIDLQTAPVGTWTTIDLSTTPDDLEISPGEFLAIHYELSGGLGGNLDVRPIFEVLVR